jgi:glycosyltransferase involved in cell wall biosynthesis
MRVALYHNLTSGGSKREAYELTRQLFLHGHIIDLYYPATADESFLPLVANTSAQYCFDLSFIADLPIRFPGITRYFDLAGFFVNLRRLVRLSQRIAQQIDRREYDWVFVHHDRIVQSPFILRYLKTPSVYYCAEPMRQFYEPTVSRPYQRPKGALGCAQYRWYAPERKLRSAFVKQNDRSNVRRATMLLTNSRFSAESIYHAYGLGARVSYLGVDSEAFQGNGLERDSFVLSVGAISPLKGYDFLIATLGKIPLTQRPALVIVGNAASQGELRYLEQLAAESAVRVMFRVNVTERELVHLYGQARALVYAPVREPFGFAPLEAMACETPVVAVKEGGVQESVVDGETGWLVEREPEEFAAALLRVLSDPARARYMGKNGREQVLAQWTWEQAYDRLIENIQHLNGSSG